MLRKGVYLLACREFMSVIWGNRFLPSNESLGVKNKCLESFQPPLLPWNLYDICLDIIIAEDKA